MDAKLSLSTASPSIGGVPPKLDTCRLTLLHYEEHQRKSKGFGFSLQKSYGGARESADLLLGGLPPGAPLTIPQAKVTEGLSSSVFEITAPATIPSDNSDHKVSIHSHGVTPFTLHVHVPLTTGLCGHH